MGMRGAECERGYSLRRVVATGAQTSTGPEGGLPGEMGGGGGAFGKYNEKKGRRDQNSPESQKRPQGHLG